MKNFTLFIMLLFTFGWAGNAFAQISDSNFEISLMGGADIPINSPGFFDPNSDVYSNNTYDLGWGGSVRGIFGGGPRLNYGFTVGYEQINEKFFQKNYIYNGPNPPIYANSQSSQDLRGFYEFLFSAKSNIVYIRHSDIYLLLGGGFTVTGIYGDMLPWNLAFPMLQAGAGFEFPAAENMNLFVEAKANAFLGLGGFVTTGLIFSSYVYFPVNVGVAFGL